MIVQAAQVDARAASDITVTPSHRARHQRAFRVEIVVLIALALGVFGFAWLANVAHTTPYFDYDLPIALAIQSIQWPPLVAFLDACSWIGFPPQSNLIFGSIILGLALIGRRGAAAGLLFAAAGSASLWYLIAPLVERPRPSPDLVHVVAPLGNTSFPSGHVVNLTAIFGFLIFLVVTQLRPSWGRTLLLILLAMPIAGIGISRVYAGQHWPSDVLGGYLLGLIWLGITVVLYRRAAQYQTHGRLFWRRPDESAAPQPPTRRVNG